MQLALASVYDTDDTIYESHYRFLYRILSERKEHQNISHRSLPTLKQHIDFVNRRPYKEWYIVYDKQTKIGSVYITERSEIGLFILEEFQNKGYGSEILSTLLNLNPKEIFYANINPRNFKSINFFKKHGFCWVASNSVNNLDVHQETYVKL